MFRLLQSGSEQFASIQVFVSAFEIYGGKLFDLLNDRKKLVMREDGAKMVNIVGLRERRCHQVSDLLELMNYGNAVRSRLLHMIISRTLALWPDNFSFCLQSAAEPAVLMIVQRLGRHQMTRAEVIEKCRLTQCIL